MLLAFTIVVGGTAVIIIQLVPSFLFSVAAL